MRDSQAGKGCPVFPGQEGLRTQQHGGGISAGFLTQGGCQGAGKPMAEGSRKPGEGKGRRRRNLEPCLPVKPHAYTATKKLLPEVVAIRIGRAGRMINPSIKGNGHAWRKTFRHLIRIKGPVGSAGQRNPIQGYPGQGGTELTIGPALYFFGNDSGNLYLTGSRQGRMIGEKPPEASEGYKKHEQGTETCPPPKQEAGGKTQQTGCDPIPGGSRYPAQQNPQRKTNRQRRQKPAPLPLRHREITAPASAILISGKTDLASRSSVSGG